MLSPRPSGKYDPIHPAMPMRPLYGVKPKLASTENNEGPLCIEKPWPGMALTIWEDHERFIKTYFADYPPYYFSGDGAMINADGHWKITGRMDDVINITGHRLGTAEVECALVSTYLEKIYSEAIFFTFFIFLEHPSHVK